MRRAGLGVAIVAVLVAGWLLLDASGVFRSDRSAPNRATTEREEAKDTPVSEDTETDTNEESGKAKRPPHPLPAPVDLSKVDLDTDLHGTVVDQNEKPVAGAKLTAIRYPARRAQVLDTKRRYDEEVGPSTRSATDGTFRIGLKRGSRWNLRVEATAFATVEMRDLNAGERVRVVLSSGVTLIVVTKDEAGNAVPGVGIRLFASSRGDEVNRRGATDGQGIARFAGIARNAVLYVESTHETLGASWKKASVGEESEHRVEVVLEEGRTLRGRVIDAETRQPIAGATVGFGWTMTKPTKTDSNGEYRVTGWTGKGHTELGVDSPDHYQELTKVGDRDVVDFELKPGGRVKGRLVDSKGAPVAEARIAVIGTKHLGMSQMLSRRYGTSANDGSFSLGGLRLDLHHNLIVLVRGFGRKVIGFVPKRPEFDAGEIWLTPGLSIEGVLLDGETPMPRTRVSIMDPGQQYFYGTGESRMTDHLGRFRFPEQSPGKFKLSVFVTGRKPLNKLITLPPDRDLLDVELKYAGSKQFTVWVHDEDGKPVADLSVHVQFEGGGATTRTDRTGAARFAVTGPVTFVNPPALYNHREYLRPKPIRNLPKGASEARFVLEKGRPVEGKVLLDGTPLKLAQIDAMRGGKRYRNVIGKQDGTFRVIVPPDGTIDLILRGRYEIVRGVYRSVPNEFLIGELRGVAPGSTDLVLHAERMARDARLVVRLLDPNGKPVAQATISIHGETGTTGADGTVIFEALPKVPGSIGVGGFQPAGLLRPKRVRVTPGGQEVVLRYGNGVPVSGILLGADGKPASGGTVFAATDNRFLSSGSADAEGRFTVYVPENPDGIVWLRASARSTDGKNTLYAVKARYFPGTVAHLQLAKQPGR